MLDQQSSKHYTPGFYHLLKKKLQDAYDTTHIFNPFPSSILKMNLTHVDLGCLFWFGLLQALSFLPDH